VAIVDARRFKERRREVSSDQFYRFYRCLDWRCYALYCTERSRCYVRRVGFYRTRKSGKRVTRSMHRRERRLARFRADAAYGAALAAHPSWTGYWEARE